MLKKLKYSKNQRLLNNSQFKVVIDNKKRYANELFVLYVAENGLQQWRLGICVTTANYCAVSRNRIRRLVREVFRVNQEKLPTGYDFVVMLAKSADKGIVEKLTLGTAELGLLKLVNRAI